MRVLLRLVAALLIAVPLLVVLVIVFALAGILCLQQSVERPRLTLFFLAGLFAGLAPIMKQPGVVFAGFVVAWWLWQEWHAPTRNRTQATLRGVVLLAGVLTPFAILFASLLVTHTWNAFWLWTISYARYYGEPRRVKVIFSQRGGHSYGHTITYGEILKQQSRSQTTLLDKRDHQLAGCGYSTVRSFGTSRACRTTIGRCHR